MINCADCKFSYVDDLFVEWCCRKKDHVIHTDLEINYPLDIECKDYEEDEVC